MTTQTAKTASGVNPVNAAETAIVTSDSVPTNEGITGEGVMVSGVLNVLTGATVTAVVVTVRKGAGVGGAIVGAARTHTIGAAANAQIAYNEVDPTPSNPAQYTVTLTQTGGTSNGTVSGTISTDPVSTTP